MNHTAVYDVSYTDAIKRGFSQYATFTGRAGRSEFWRFMLTREIIVNAIGLLYTLSLHLLGDKRTVTEILYWMDLCLFLVYILPTLAYTCRRLHDIGKSGVLLWIGVIPIIGFFVVLYHLVQPGDTSSNVYGDPVAYIPVTKDMESQIGLEATPTYREDAKLSFVAFVLYMMILIPTFVDSLWAGFNASIIK